MAPPTKRRKLSSSGGSARIYRDNSTALDSLPSYSQSAESIHGCTTPEPPRLQHSPTPTEDVLHQEVKRAAVGEVPHFAGLIPRQDADPVSSNTTPTPVLAGSIQIFTDASTTLTYTPPALPSLPTLPSVPGATTFSSTTSTLPTSSSSLPESYADPSSNSSTISSGNATISTSASSSLTTSAIILIGNNSTTTSKTTITITRSSTSTLYYATLDDGDVSTITRSSTAFTTTVDGEVFTVPGYFDSQVPLQSSTSTTSIERSTTTTSTSAVSGAGGAQTYGTPANTGAAGPTSTDASNTDDGGNHNSTPPAGTIAGGVVGGCAGLAVVVLIAMLFVRWYRRKSQMGHQALPPGTAGGSEEQSRSAPGMAERAGMVPFAAAVPALFRQQNRSTEPEQSERGFTRISGRKLPSQWSEGIHSSQAPNMPLTATTTAEDGAGRNLSNASFDRDSQGLYGGNGGDLSPGAASPESINRGPLRTSDPGSVMMMSRGPERQPQVHYGGAVQRPGQASTLSTTPPAAGALGRSETPSSILDPKRSSRFTEDM